MTGSTSVTTCPQCRAELWANAPACWKCGASTAANASSSFSPPVDVEATSVGRVAGQPSGNAATTNAATTNAATTFAATTVPQNATPQTITQGVSTPLALASGEEIRYQTQFHPRLILKHLAVSIVLTNRRMIVQVPHTLFGVIPHGFAEHSARLDTISDVSSGDIVSSRKITQGVVAAVAGLYALFVLSPVNGTIGGLGGLVLLGVAVYMFISARSMALVGRSFGAGVLAAPAGRNERALLDHAKVVLNELLVGSSSVSAGRQ